MHSCVEHVVQRSFISSWRYVVAHDSNTTGRIWVSWNPLEVDITILYVGLQ